MGTIELSTDFKGILSPPNIVIMTSDSRLLTIGFVSGGSIKPVPDEVNGHTAADKVHFLFLNWLGKLSFKQIS